MKTFHNQATAHYIRANQLFYATIVKAPALILVSDNDVIAPPKNNIEVIKMWEPAGIKVTFKNWEKSGHVAHMLHHREEYIAILYKHLEENMLGQLVIKASAKL